MKPSAAGGLFLYEVFNALSNSVVLRTLFGSVVITIIVFFFAALAVSIIKFTRGILTEKEIKLKELFFQSFSSFNSPPIHYAHKFLGILVVVFAIALILKLEVGIENGTDSVVLQYLFPDLEN